MRTWVSRAPSPQQGALLPPAQDAGLGLWDALEVGGKSLMSLSDVEAIQIPFMSIISFTRQPGFVEIFTKSPGATQRKDTVPTAAVSPPSPPAISFSLIKAITSLPSFYSC